MDRKINKEELNQTQKYIHKHTQREEHASLNTCTQEKTQGKKILTNIFT